MPAPAPLPPVIDVHVHAMEESFPSPGVCPNAAQFLASTPATETLPSGWSHEDCTPRLYPSEKGKYLSDVAAEMKRLNVTAVVFGAPADVKKWMDAAPGQVIPGTSFTGGSMAQPSHVPVEELRKDFTSGGFKVMGEIGLQYEGSRQATRPWTSTLRWPRNWISRWRSIWVRVDPDGRM